MVDILIQLACEQSVGSWIKPNNGAGVFPTQTLAKQRNDVGGQSRKQEGHLHVNERRRRKPGAELQDSGWPMERVPPTNYFFYFLPAVRV